MSAAVPPFRLIFATKPPSILFTVIFSPSLLALMASVLAGLAKTTVTKDPLPLRSWDSPLPGTPSSSSIA